MNKKVKKLIMIAVVLIVLLAVYFTAMFLMKKSKKDKKDDDSIAVSQVGAENITAFSYSCEDTNNEFIRLYRENDVWYYDADKEFPINQDFVTSMAKSVADVSANRKLEGEIGQLSEYGLDQPLVTVHLELKDGSKQNFFIGNYNENAESYYLRIDGDDSIYLVDGSLKLNFSMSLYDLVKVADFPLVEENSFSHIKVDKDGSVFEFKGDVEDDAKEYISDKDYMENLNL